MGRIALQVVGGTKNCGELRNGTSRLWIAGYTGSVSKAANGSSKDVMKLQYIELHARSAFSFLRAASQPEKLVEQAANLELPAMAVCDRDGVYGTARVHAAAREQKIRPIVGAELTLEDGSVLPMLVESREGYRNLCKLITRAKLRGTKEYAPVHWNDLPEFSNGLVALTGDEEGPIRRAI